MSVSSSITRFTEYLKRHGLASTLRRAGEATKRAVFASRMVVFYCDLSSRKPRLMHAPEGCRVQRIRSLEELDSNLFQEMTGFWNPTLAQRSILKRFEQGASLWLIESEKQLAGFGWTLEGDAIEPYYFPLATKDVQLFDFYIFPEFRGGTLYWLLTNYILCSLAAEGCKRAFADTHEWNRAQLAAFSMTPFRALGSAKTYKLFGQMFTRWCRGGSVVQIGARTGTKAKTVAMLRLNE